MAYSPRRSGMLTPNLAFMTAAKNTVAGKINGKLADASDLIKQNAQVQIIMPKDRDGVDITGKTLSTKSKPLTMRWG